MKTIKTIIAFIFFISLVAGTASGYDTNSAKYITTCSENGAIEIKSPNTIGESNAYKVDIKAKKTGDTKIFNVPGTWLSGNFKSKEAVFNETGNYTITLTFEQKDTVEKEIACPGLVFSCSIFSVDISRCYMENGIFTAVFEEKNPAIYGWDMLANLTYIASDDKGQSTTLNPKAGNIIKIDTFESFDISRLEEDIYSLRWKTAKNIILFHVRAPVCNTASSVKCTAPPACTKNEDCLDFEYCDKYCKILSCLSREHASGHQCVTSCKSDNECDDTLACTKDICINNRCASEQTTCTTKDSCTTAKCEEPKGCTYATDNECKKRELEKAEPQPTQKQAKETNDSGSGDTSAILIIMLIAIIALVIYIINLKKGMAPKKSDGTPQKKQKQKQAKKDKKENDEQPESP